MNIYTFSDYCRDHFSEKLWKIPLDGGFTCPNRDGTKGIGGCAFCSGGSGYFCAPGSVREQLEAGRRQLAGKSGSGRYIAYFQRYTGTYAPLARLRTLYREALLPEDVAMLDIATRPDCLAPDVLSLLGEIASEKPLIIELGLQTADDRTAESFNRGYPTAAFDRAVAALRHYPIHIVAHMMLGLPGEGTEAAARTAEHLNRVGIDGVKLHLTYISEGTPYASLYRAGRIRAMTLPEYTEAVLAVLKTLHAGTVIHRLTGDAPRKELIAPLWSTDKKRVYDTLRKAIAALPE